jgi:8-oxo-dGTP pyrophosphatase MutT (NUDIX family)
MDFDPQLPGKIAARLATRTPQEALDPGSRPASVLIPMFIRDGAWHLLFTQRTETVQSHRGQISFPGGSRDPEDATALDTALRETEEEIGLKRQDVSVLGQLDERLTVVTGYRIWPFVGTFPYPYQFVPSPFEIAQILELPLMAFLEPANVETRIFTLPDGRSGPVYYYHIGEHTVWGATGRIMTDFVEIVREALQA